MHETQSCQEVEEECQKCQMTLKRKEIQLHLTTQCPEAEISCEECGTQFMRKQKDQHNCIKSLLARIE